MNKREACEWVHVHLLVDSMPFDELVAAFTALVGRVPDKDHRSAQLFRRCCEIVMATGVPARHAALAMPARRAYGASS